MHFHADAYDSRWEFTRAQFDAATSAMRTFMPRFNQPKPRARSPQIGSVRTDAHMT